MTPEERAKSFKKSTEQLKKHFGDKSHAIKKTLEKGKGDYSGTKYENLDPKYRENMIHKARIKSDKAKKPNFYK